MERPLVSILIPCYNCEAWVSRAIETALAQTWEPKEIIVLDDGSSDRSLEIIQSFGNVIQAISEPNRGQNGARNRLTGLSKGEWLQYLDADDELAPDKIEKQMMLAEQADVMYSSVEATFYRDLEYINSDKRLAEGYNDSWCAGFRWQFPNTTAFLFRRSAICSVGGWNESLKNCTDYGLYFPLLLEGLRFRATPDAWSIYRQWSSEQAVYQAPQRLVLARLQVMWNAVLKLEETQLLTIPRKQAFEESTFLVIRTLHLLNREKALKELQRLKEWNQNFCPQGASISKFYRWSYNLVGFSFAEILATVTRPLRHPWITVSNNRH